ncbi:hypothetical protein SARC_04610 [Sphaeroforma arctica JP610]|uniref:Uncharacterized protein n=1 Tax=Sphaeroforma arctica JP610 TaxID=667725 RepID=A0A0L0G1V9_9EUKA|nr:hypothetical protein SARC_04610 [Sphaeroforma arctica JP610]KNC83112.1 hypothetical protein SARC_04610 [Sphaeroforma arctica JP610]|eukprot:XP_014157014.1 hypothetical protein SARC_04610 [Sphaeroforma arctica JP610]
MVSPLSAVIAHDTVRRYNDYRHLNNTVVDHISTNRRRKTSHYVLWLDADVEYIPNTIISDLIGSGKHVITPRCLREGLDYDLNTWAGERIEATRPSQYRHLLFVPYPGTLNKNMRDFAESGEEFVEVDSVGGTALLVRSDVSHSLQLVGLLYTHVRSATLFISQMH